MLGDTDGRFGSKEGQVGHKYDKSGALKSDLKKPRICPIWDQSDPLGAKPTINGLCGSVRPDRLVQLPSFLLHSVPHNGRFLQRGSHNKSNCNMYLIANHYVRWLVERDNRSEPTTIGIHTITCWDNSCQ